MDIEYIGNRATFKDNIYHTDTVFQKGKIYSVNDKLGKKFLAHKDCFRLATKSTSETKTVQNTQNKQQSVEDILDIHQQIDSFNNPASLRKFIKETWGVETEKTAKLVELKAQAKQLTDQFGAE